MADVNTEVLQAASQATYGLDYPGGLRRATGLNLDPNGICRTLWGKEFNEAGPEMLSLLSSHGLRLNGASGAYASTPDHASLDIVGDIDIRAEFVNFAPTQQNYALVAKWTATGNQKSYYMGGGAFGLPILRWSATGSAELSSLGILTFVPLAFRMTLDVNNGAAGNTTVQYHSTSLDDTFVQFDDEIKAGTTSIFSSTAPLTVGASDAGTAGMFVGMVKRVELRNSAGTIVANPDFRNLAPGTTSFADSTGKTWTVHGGAVVV